MSVADVLDRLDAAGGNLSLDGDTLRVRAPRGALTDTLRAELATHKAAIIAALSAPPEPASTATAAAPTPPERHAIPALCIAATVCPSIGICGRRSCIPVDEQAAWADAISAARCVGNVRRIPDEWFGEGPS